MKSSGSYAAFSLVVLTAAAANGAPSAEAESPWRQPGGGRVAPATQPVAVGGERQLFVDDYLIAETTNLARRLNKPVKHAQNPLVVGDKPWEHGHLCFPSVLYIDGEFRMWYLAHGLSNAARRDEIPMADSSFLCYATSRDGVHWTKPTLGHIAFRGSRKNNIVLRHQGSHFDSFSVMYRPGQAYPYKMLAYQGRWPYKEDEIEERGYEFAIGKHGHYPFQSKDGIHWEYVQDEPDIAWAWDRSNAGYDTKRGTYMGFWKRGYKRVRVRMHAESDDLVHWTKPRWLLIPEWLENPDSRVDPKGTHFYGHYLFNYGSQYLGLLEILTMDDLRMHIQLIGSRDLHAWTRTSAPEPFIDHGAEGRWDSGMVIMPGTGPILHDGKLWFYYAGANYPHRRSDREGERRSIGLATLPRDRFATLLPADRGRDGLLTTVPVTLGGKALHINADAAEGQVRVEVLDGDGEVLDGLGRDDCRGLARKDSLDFAVRWTSGQVLPDEPVRLRFVISRASLFSFWTE